MINIWFEAHVYDGKVELTEYHVRSIRRGTHYLTAKVKGVTWVHTGKFEKACKVYGWAKYTPVGLSAKFFDGKANPGYGRSKSAAVRSQLAQLRACEKAFGPDDEEREDIAALERWLKRNKK